MPSNTKNMYISVDTLLSKMEEKFLDSKRKIENGNPYLDSLAEGYTEIEILVHEILLTRPDAVAHIVRCVNCDFRDGKKAGQPNIVCWNMHEDAFCSYCEEKESSE